MTDDDFLLANEESYDAILNCAYETSHGYTFNEERWRRTLGDVADYLSTMPPGWHEDWANYVDERRTYIDRAISLLRAAQCEDPADAAAALRDYLEEAA